MAWGENYLRIWNRRNPLEVIGMFSPDCRFEDAHMRVVYEGHNGIKSRLNRIRQVVPDLHYTHRSGFTNFDRFAIEWAASGTSAGTPFVIRGSSIGLFDGWGLIASNCDYWDPVAESSDPATAALVHPAQNW